MGYDLYSKKSQEYFRANICGMGMLRQAMEDILDFDNDKSFPKWDE